MQINENQKAVSKNLRNTLNAELLWDSPSLKEKHDAIKLKIAQQLGEDKNSALYNRVQLGEETSSQRNITIDSIKIGLDHSNFIGEFSKNEVKKAGLLYYGKKEKTLDSLFNLVKEYLYYIKSELPFEWDKTESSSGVVVINASIIALLMLFSDIVNHVRITRHIDIKDYSPEQLIDFIKPFMKPVIEYYKNISKEERVRIKNSYYGAAGRRIYWRKLQEKVHAHYPEFCPNGLEDYLSDKQKNYRLDTQRIISEIEEFLSNDFKSRLIDKYGESGGAWYKKGWPEKVYTDASKIAIEKNRAVVEEENEYQPWQCLVLINYRDIALYNDNWETLFKEKYTTPEEEQTNKSKKQKTVWMVKLNEIRNKAFHVGDNINEDEHGFVRNIKEWLFSD